MCMWKLFLVDDGLVIQKIVWLIFFDYFEIEVYCVSSGDEVFEIIDDWFLDIVFVDVYMLGVDGYEVC